jgi:hypothetical protein
MVGESVVRGRLPGASGRVVFLEPEHLRAAAEAEAEFRNHRRGLQPAAGRRRRNHVAGRIDDVEMHGVAAHLAEAADGRLAGAHGAHRLAMASWRRSFTTAPKPSTEPGTKSSEALSEISLRRSSL